MEETEKRELQLLPPTAASVPEPPAAFKPSADQSNSERPKLDLSLSMSVAPSKQRSVPALKKHAAEQLQLAAFERAYAERIRELTRRELAVAEKEFRRARLIWERAREELEKVERLKMAATSRISSACIEITCQACHQHFLP